MPSTPVAHDGVDPGATTAEIPAVVLPTTRVPPAGTAAAGTRLPGVDAARGVALLGMMAVHSLVEVDEAGRETLPSMIASGTSAALFAVLAGVGIAFTTGRRRVVRRNRAGVGPSGGGAPHTAAATAASLVARGLAVGVVGLVLGQGDVSLAAVILGYYAALFVLAVPLVLLGRRTLLVLGALLTVGAPVLGQLVRPFLPAPRLDNPTLGWLLSDPGGLVVELTLTGYYPAVSWLPYLCVGLAVGRMRLSSRGVAAALTATGVVLAALAQIASDLLLGAAGGLARIAAVTPVAPGDAPLAPGDAPLSPDALAVALAPGLEGTTPTTTWWWLTVAVPHSSTPFDLAHTIGTSLAVLGFMLLATHLVGGPARVVRFLMTPLAAAGSTTLTFYALHVWFINSPLDVYSPGVGYVVQVVAVLALGTAWRLTAGRGPLEATVTAVGRAAARAVVHRS